MALAVVFVVAPFGASGDKRAPAEEPAARERAAPHAERCSRPSIAFTFGGENTAFEKAEYEHLALLLVKRALLVATARMPTRRSLDRCRTLLQQGRLWSLHIVEGGVLVFYLDGYVDGLPGDPCGPMPLARHLNGHPEPAAEPLLMAPSASGGYRWTLTDLGAPAQIHIASSCTGDGRLGSGRGRALVRQLEAAEAPE